MLLKGLNHVATITNDADRLQAFYRQVFDAEILRDGSEFPEGRGPRLSIIKIGEWAELNVFQIEGNTEADRQTPMFGRGRIDHLALQAASLEDFETIRQRLMDRGAGDDPVNGSDPSGLCSDWNPVCDAEGAAHAAVSVADDVRHDAAAGADWVAEHPQIAIGIGLGVVAVATGGLGLAAIAGYGAIDATLVGGISVAAGIGASALDYGGCFGNSSDATTKTLSCIGFGSGLVGAALGAIPLFAAESAFALQFGIYGLAFGLGGNIADVANAFFQSSNCQS